VKAIEELAPLIEAAEKANSTCRVAGNETIAWLL